MIMQGAFAALLAREGTATGFVERGDATAPVRFEAVTRADGSVRLQARAADGGQTVRLDGAWGVIV